MPEMREQRRGRVYARTLLLAGGAVGAVAVALALGGAGKVTPGNQANSSPQAMDTRQGTNGMNVAAPSLPQQKSTTSSAGTTRTTSATTGERDGVAGSAKPVAIRSHAHLDAPRGHHGSVRPQPPAHSSADRYSPPPSHRVERAPHKPRPTSPGNSEHNGGPSLFGMKCDELFPPHKREFRLRNTACHRLLG